MITIPFDVERAKKIQAGEEPGKIVTREGCDVRIVCWDVKDNDFPIVAALTSLEDKNNESVLVFKEDGRSCHHENFKEDRFDLLIQVPEWTQFKDGDILACEKEIGKRSYSKYLYILKGNVNPTEFSIYFESYVSYSCNPKDEFDEPWYDDGCSCLGDSVRLATDEEKQGFIVALKASTYPRAKEYLKRFFGIEEKQEQKFEFLQPVLVRDGKDDSWKYGEFTFERECLYYVNGGFNWVSCIPYNEQTKHLLGTTDNWEE